VLWLSIRIPVNFTNLLSEYCFNSEAARDLVRCLSAIYPGGKQQAVEHIAVGALYLKGILNEAPLPGLFPHTFYYRDWIGYSLDQVYQAHKYRLVKLA